MHDSESIQIALTEIRERLDAIDDRLEDLGRTRHKSLEWVGQLAEQLRGLDAFREEVRRSFEPLFAKLESMDEIVRILRHATADVARRVERIERSRDAAA